MNSSAQTGPQPKTTLPARLNNGDVHVWTAPLNVPASALEQFSATLSDEEQDRAVKFRFDRHRNRFIAGRGLMRSVLSCYLQVAPSDITFTYSSRGKPELAMEFRNSGFHFNLAHSEDLAVMAVSRIGEIGVDVEHIRPIKDVDHLVARFFSTRENELFQKVPETEKPAAFFNLWTRKEALLKATGEGIGHSLKLVEVSFLPDEPAHVLAIQGEREKAGRWTLKNLPLQPGFAGALAVEAKDIRVECGSWESGNPA